MQILPSVKPFRTKSLASLMVIILLGLIVVVLIAPHIDLPDTAFQRNHSMHVVRTLSHRVPAAIAHIDFFVSSSAIEDARITADQLQLSPE
jgi:hypothetical protein